VWRHNEGEVIDVVTPV